VSIGRSVIDVLRGEGLASALRRSHERIDEAVARRVHRASTHARILNYCATRVAARTGGVAIQLLARLREERTLREVALHERHGLAAAMQRSGASVVHLEGTADADLEALAQLRTIVSLHDLTALAMPGAAELLASAIGVIFPSPFLMERYRERFPFDGVVIEPASPAQLVRVEGERMNLAFAGNVRAHKGAQLLAPLARMLPRRTLHVFGGGDVALLRELRALPNVVVHGYYRAGTLPALLARHRVGLLVLPSMVEESFSLTLSEAWLAQCAVAAFDRGAPAERIRREGGGWLAPRDSGAEGLAAIVERWNENVPVPRVLATPRSAAEAHVAFYRARGLV
jgi:hypothetical protein